VSELIDLSEKVHRRRIEQNRLRNERYLIRNELVKLFNIISNYKFEEHGLLKFKENILDEICKLNTQIAKDTGNDYTKISPNY
jgi:hypothetical protein